MRMRYYNDTLDELIERARGETLEQQRETYGEIQRILVDDVPSLVIANHPELYGARNNVQDAGPYILRAIGLSGTPGWKNKRSGHNAPDESTFGLAYPVGMNRSALAYALVSRRRGLFAFRLERSGNIEIYFAASWNDATRADRTRHRCLASACRRLHIVVG